MKFLLINAALCALAVSGTAAAQVAPAQSVAETAQAGSAKNTAGGETIIANYSGAWYTPSESGWGIAVAKGDSGTYGVSFYHFGQDHQPVWYLLLSPSFNGTVLSGVFYRFSGAWLGEAYSDVPLTSVPAGTGAITFTSPTTATFSYTIDGAGSFTKSLTRLSF